MEQNKTNEPIYRINLKQNSKGLVYFDVTVRGDTTEEVIKRLDEAVKIAKDKCSKLNGGVE